MAKKSIFELTFSLNVLHPLGIGLYSKISAVLSEMVANSWDSGATRVSITLEKDRIVIEDNGRGMSLDELNEKYLRVGYQRRKVEPLLVVEGETRHVMGRKGIGKLSAFSIANIVDVQSCKDGEKNGFSMSLTELEAEIDKGSLTYFPQPLTLASVAMKEGTRITLRDLRYLDLGMEQELRTNLARRFSVLNREQRFEVIVNGTPITLKDRDYYEKIQFLWYFGDESALYKDRCPNLKHSVAVQNVVDPIDGLKVFGWIATVGKPKDIDDQQHTVSIFANGKLIQEDILAELQDARLFRTYLIGEIDADFMDSDNEADIVTSDRQRINQTDPRYIILRNFLASEIKKIGNSWDALRSKYPGTRSGKGVANKQANKQPSQTIQPTLLDSNILSQSDSLLEDFLPAEAPIGTASTNELLTIDKAQEEASFQKAPEPSHVGTRPISPPSREAQSFIGNIRESVLSSSLEQEFKDIILYDLDQARLAYYNQAYKACVIMLGAVLEGLMLGRLRQPDMMERILADTNLPKQLKEKLKGQRNPIYIDRAAFAQALATELNFDDYRELIYRYIPILKELGIEHIQHFRNAIHPWLSIHKPTVYKTNTAARAITYLGSLEIMAREILSRVVP